MKCVRADCLVLNLPWFRINTKHPFIPQRNYKPHLKEFNYFTRSHRAVHVCTALPGRNVAPPSGPVQQHNPSSALPFQRHSDAIRRALLKKQRGPVRRQNSRRAVWAGVGTVLPTTRRKKCCNDTSVFFLIRRFALTLEDQNCPTFRWSTCLSYLRLNCKVCAVVEWRKWSCYVIRRSVPSYCVPAG
jgi:hypothetical protein